MKSKAERLEDVFNHYAESVERIDVAGMAEARRSIHRIYKESVPNELSHNHKNDEESCNCDWIEGYNDSRNDTLKNIEEMEK